MNINPKVLHALDRIFPDKSTSVEKSSQTDDKIKECLENVLIKGCELYEGVMNIAGKFNSFYRSVWTPYYILKAPRAYKMKLSETSVEKNIEVLSNINASNAWESVMTSSVYRTIPWASLSKDSQNSIANKIGNLAFLSPLIYAPAMNTIRCISQGEGVNTYKLHQIQLDIGNCLEKSSRIYQGPEAILAIITGVTLGTFLKITLSAATSILLKDRDLAYRYTTLEKIYSDVAMHLKNRWDIARASDDKKEKAELTAIANKIACSIDLIANSLTAASLTPAQTTHIKEILNWSTKYILTV